LSWRRRLVENMRIDSSFENPDKSHIYSIQDFLKRGQREFLSLLAEWCRQIEVKRKFDTILHSVEDFIVIMEENENSIFITDSSFDPEYPILAKVRGVAFPEVSEGFSDPLRIVGLYTQEKFMDEDNGSREEEIREPEGKEEEFEPEILGDILKEFQKSNLELLLPYSGESDQDGEVEPYAMIKILDENRKMLQSDENRKFEISLMLD
ncbi:MAG: hypothetical protein K2K98_11645, partial [Muribaculaceae bacterium]|nr:hypothetical protein [Muribaculaceae bacterium]